MSKVLVERPRWDRPSGGSTGSAYPRGSLRPRDLESAPQREGMGRGYATKSLSENLRPLERFLRRSVGRPWRLVYAEIASRVSLQNAVQRHILQHLWQMVALDAWREGDRILNARGPVASRGTWGRFWVCRDTGLLRLAPQAKRRVVAPDADRRVLDELHELHRIDGIWYAIELAPRGATACGGRRSLPLEAQHTSVPGLAKGRIACSKRQLSTRELVVHGLRT